MKDLNDGYFSVTKEELKASLEYHGEATFYIDGSLATYNNPNDPEMMDGNGVVGEMSLWQFNDGKTTVIFDTVEEALSYKLQDGKTIADSVGSFKFDDFV